MITSGEGKYRVWLKQHQLDEDVILILGGGERSHVGGIVICEPGKPAEIISFEGHRDTEVLQPLAEYACATYQKKVVALGGIHIDHASKEEISLLIQNCEKLKDKM